MGHRLGTADFGVVLVVEFRQFALEKLLSHLNRVTPAVEPGVSF